MNNYGKIVGVTFENRQNLLKNLMESNRFRGVSLIHTTYTDENGVTEPAIEVRDYETKQTLGWIAKTEINRYNGIYDDRRN